ncbi:MAG: hypothetical protein FWC03_00550 [Treponema sp.]|nr:hypothetical protein [Treponema sp.]
MKLYIYYRISDKSRPKEKLLNGDRFSCLRNAIKEFGAENIHVIADNCEKQTVDFIRSFEKDGLTHEEITLGNSGSFVFMLDKIIKTRKPDDYVYLLEDDYLHKSGSKKVILEGLEIADYVTLYDHPDKYKLTIDGGNYFNIKNLQKTRIYLTKSTHWRECNSTTMTFSCKVQTLIDNYHIWKKYTKTFIPKDNLVFCEISQSSISDLFMFFIKMQKTRFLILLRNQFKKNKMKNIISAIPSFSTHTELASIAPIINWDVI